MIPRHRNPTQPARTAMAPYNFVPLPEKVYCVETGIEVRGEKIKPWERQDEFIAGTNHGWIDLEICTLTPLFIRGAVTRDNNGLWDRRPEPYLTPEGRPAIPGSSLRGMVRSLVEILSFAKIQPVTDQKPFFRTVSDDRIGKEYRARVLRGGQKPTGGFVRRDGDNWTIAPCEVVRVSREMLTRAGLRFPDKPSYTPDWSYQHRECWVRMRSESDEVKEIKFRPGTDEGDYQVKLRNVRRFLEDGDKAKITLRFRGREMAHQDIGMQVLNRIENDLQDFAIVEQRPKLEGRQMVMVLTPKKGK